MIEVSVILTVVYYMWWKSKLLKNKIFYDSHYFLKFLKNKNFKKNRLRIISSKITKLIRKFILISYILKIKHNKIKKIV